MFRIRSHPACGIFLPTGPALLTLLAALVIPLAATGCEDQATSSATGAGTGNGSETAPPASQPAETPPDNGGTAAPDPGAGNGEEDLFPPIPTPRRITLTFFPKNWFFYPPNDSSSFDRPPLSEAMDGEIAPPLVVERWFGEAQDLAKLKGKVVVLHFWATHRPKVESILERNKALIHQYRGQGVVFIGIHDSMRSPEDLADLEAAIETFDLDYPIGIDDGGTTAKDYALTLYPYFVVIDHWGYVRAAGLRTSRLVEVVDTLIEQRKEAREQADAGS